MMLLSSPVIGIPGMGYPAAPSMRQVPTQQVLVNPYPPTAQSPSHVPRAVPVDGAPTTALPPPVNAPQPPMNMSLPPSPLTMPSLCAPPIVIPGMDFTSAVMQQAQVAAAAQALKSRPTPAMIARQKAGYHKKIEAELKEKQEALKLELDKNLKDLKQHMEDEKKNYAALLQKEIDEKSAALDSEREERIVDLNNDAIVQRNILAEQAALLTHQATNPQAYSANALPDFGYYDDQLRPGSQQNYYLPQFDTDCLRVEAQQPLYAIDQNGDYVQLDPAQYGSLPPNPPYGQMYGAYEQPMFQQGNIEYEQPQMMPAYGTSPDLQACQQPYAIGPNGEYIPQTFVLN